MPRPVSRLRLALLINAWWEGNLSIDGRSGCGAWLVDALVRSFGFRRACRRRSGTRNRAEPGILTPASTGWPSAVGVARPAGQTLCQEQGARRQ
jgi:hypothetical protein